MATPIATVLSMTGQAWARDVDGNLRPLEPGDIIMEGEQLITADNGQVQLNFDDAEPVSIGSGQSVDLLSDLNIDAPIPQDEATVLDDDLETLLSAIEEGEGDLFEELEAPAAGLGGGEGGGGSGFVRLARISESIDPLSFETTGTERIDNILPEVGGEADTSPEFNVAPVANDDANSGTEDAALSGNVLSNDRDVDGDPLTVSDFSINGSTYQAGDTAELDGIGSLIINSDGSYTFTPAENWNGQVPAIHYTVSDGELSDTAVLELTVTPVNGAPVAADDTNSGAEDTALSGNILSNDSDPENDPLTVRDFNIDGSTYPAGETVQLDGIGSLTLNSDGSYTFTPVENWNGHVPAISYTVSDGELSDTGTLELTVTPVNDIPIAKNDEAAQEEENTPITIDVFANDEAGGDGVDLIGGVALVADSLSGNGRLVYNENGTFTYTPAEGEEGQVSFDYTITDTDGDSDTATATITLQDDSKPAVGVVLAEGDDGVVSESALTNGSGGGDLTVSGSMVLETGNDTLDFFEVQAANGDWVKIEADGTQVQGEYGVATVNMDGSWAYTLSDNTLDHDDDDLTGADDQVQDAFQIRVTDSDGDVSPEATLAVAINDDGPVAAGDGGGDGNEVVIDDFQVNGISGEWTNVRGGSTVNGNDQVPNGIGIIWGGSNFASASGYKFEYASVVDIESSAVSGEPVSLGEFTHVNNPITAGTDITGVTLELTVEVMLNGVVYQVPVEVVLGHEETSNNHPIPGNSDNDDIITIESVTITDPNVLSQLEAGGYQFDIKGFKDKGGVLVEEVTTTEGDSSSFDLYASVSYIGEETLIDAEGGFDVSWGADGPADEDGANEPITFTGADDVEIGLDANGQAEVMGEYGTLSVTVVDGKVSYEYTLSTAGREALKADDSLSESIRYTLTDADGDRVTSQINLDFTAVSAPIELVDTINNAVIDLVPSDSNAWEKGNVSANTSVWPWDWSEGGSGASEFSLNEGDSATITFNVDIETNGWLSSADVKATILKQNDQGSWEEVGSWLYIEDGQKTLPIDLNGPGSYQLSLTTTAQQGLDKEGSSASATNINIAVTSWEHISPIITDNILTEVGVSLGSNDTRLEIEVDGVFKEVEEEGTEIRGQYGTLTLNPDGSYSYAADPVLENLGGIEQFNYQVVNERGDLESATLSIRLDSNTESVIWGSEAGDTLERTAGNDILVGGVGDDTLTGGKGGDVFKWNLGDQGDDMPAHDVITDFSNGDDKIDISDLLQGEDTDNIGQYVFAEEDGGDTVLYISSEGNSSNAPGNVDQTIRLQDKSFNDFGVASGEELIAKMIDNSQLSIDQ